ncbi:MAG TPA: methyltransferase domain-containing protein, partial [Terriglobales bacterium]|nr:methyltransferase domain-containing protein [Terriglobales bacterium]
ALYFVNTLGSGAACIVVARPLLSSLGQAGSVRCAAVVNLLVGASALIYSLHSAQPQQRQSEPGSLVGPSANTQPLLPFALALLCACFCGFTALSYEIVWYRLLAFTSDDTAPLFAALLGSYLIGIALGSRFAEGYAERHSSRDAVPILALTLLAAGVVSFWINPVCAWVLKFIPTGHGLVGWLAAFVFLLAICHATILFGALFPLIAHVAVGPQHAGQKVSYLYAANIAGSTLGVLLVGFVLMDKFPIYTIAWLLLVGSTIFAAVVFRQAPTLRGRRAVLSAVACIVFLIIAPASHSIFSTIYDRLLFKNLYPRAYFEQVIANRSGTIGITPEGIVFGGGVYDGRFNTDLLNDVNMIVRPYALSAFHPAPSRVLMIGLGSGSWAQVVANNPLVRELTVIDINPGYLEAIPRHSSTASLLQNPKVTIITDDGRRWLQRHPQESFEVIVMNTTFHWRNHISNLLSTDFLQIARAHLRPGGVLFYNTTGSDDVIATGLAVFPYGLRVYNALALSDSPLLFNRERWKSVLLSYNIDGKPVVDASRPEQLQKLNFIVSTPDGPPVGKEESIEQNDEMRRRLQSRQNLIITDDNMGVEWR